jgi:hypothetical protein
VLVHAVSGWAFEHWRVDTAWMCADPDDVAIGIYAALGYATVDEHWGLQRRAPEDEPSRAPGKTPSEPLRPSS